jgi:UDP-N-acetyl-D-glucosamine dehydrogenase
LRVGEDFFVAFAPERIDPGNARYTVHNTPKLVSGITSRCGELAGLLFDPIVERVITVDCPEVAEMAKLVENTFRFINISFMNEVALLCDRVGISVWNVIEAAATKPFAFMPHYPGPGVGGHCIPIVPFFLEAAAHERGMGAELIEVAGRINAGMPWFVVEKLDRLLAESGKSPARARVLLLGITYKADISDCRESPSLRVLEAMLTASRDVAYFDPLVPSITFANQCIRSIQLDDLAEQRFDAVVLLTPHSGIDYVGLSRQADFVLDTRNYLPEIPGATIIKL